MRSLIFSARTKQLLYNRKHSTEQNRKTTKTLKLETEKYPIPDSNDLNYRTHKNQVKIDTLAG